MSSTLPAVPLRKRPDDDRKNEAPNMRKITPPPKPIMSFYRRRLPCPPSIAFGSPDGRKIFQEALIAETMHSYFPLAEQFRTQNDPTYCGLGTLTMALNALAIDPGRSWKGVWRWFSEEMLDCCKSLNAVKNNGLDLEEFHCLARCNGSEGKIKRPDDYTLDQFRADVARVCRDETNKEVLVLNYSRKTLLQTGDGHFSPVGGYHAKKDLVLILDVARFKYPPHWCPVETVYKSMKPKDSATNKSRGWITLKASPDPNPLIFRWNKDISAMRKFIDNLSNCFECTDCPDQDEVKAARQRIEQAVICALHDECCTTSRLGETASREINMKDALSQKHEELRQLCIKHLRTLEVYKMISKLKETVNVKNEEALDGLVLSLLVAVPMFAKKSSTRDLFSVDAKKMPDLEREVRALRRQLGHSCVGQNVDHNPGTQNEHPPGPTPPTNRRHPPCSQAPDTKRASCCAGVHDKAKDATDEEKAQDDASPDVDETLDSRGSLAEPAFQSTHGMGWCGCEKKRHEHSNTEERTPGGPLITQTRWSRQPAGGILVYPH